MARSYANSTRYFRAVIVRTMDTGTVDTYTYGPYDTPAPAKGQITYWEGQAEGSRGKWRDPKYAFSVECRIESTALDWKPVSADD